MRVNKKSSNYTLDPTDRAPAVIRRHHPYFPRKRAENEALPRTFVGGFEPYRSGAGDVPRATRPGSMDAFALPSRGMA